MRLIKNILDRKILFSTVSSGINSASALIMEDFVLPYRPTLNQSKQVKISKCLGKFFVFSSTVIKLYKTFILIKLTFNN